MPGIALDEDSIDEILYLARANETSELGRYLSEVSTQLKHEKAELVAAAIDPVSKNSALHYGAANGHYDIVKLLLSCDDETATESTPAILNATNDAGNTPLHWAALNGHLECVKLLVQSGADVTIINKAGHDAVFEAEINDKRNVVDWLLGAVEDLEKGIGQSGESSGQKLDDMDVDVEVTNNGTGGLTNAGASDVEDARRHMADLKTDGPAQGGFKTSWRSMSWNWGVFGPRGREYALEVSSGAPSE